MALSENLSHPSWCLGRDRRSWAVHLAGFVGWERAIAFASDQIASGLCLWNPAHRWNGSSSLEIDQSMLVCFSMLCQQLSGVNAGMSWYLFMFVILILYCLSPLLQQWYFVQIVAWLGTICFSRYHYSKCDDDFPSYILNWGVHFYHIDHLSRHLIFPIASRSKEATLFIWAWCSSIAVVCRIRNRHRLRDFGLRNDCLLHRVSPINLILIYMILTVLWSSFAIGLGPVPFVMIPEVSPPHVSFGIVKPRL